MMSEHEGMGLFFPTASWWMERTLSAWEWFYGSGEGSEAKRLLHTPWQSDLVLPWLCRFSDLHSEQVLGD